METRLYFVALVPDPVVEQQVHAFKADLSDRFGTKAAMKSPAHITLFSPFRFSGNEQALFAALQEAANGMSAFPVKLENFDSFPPRVIFVDVHENELLMKLQRKVKTVFLGAVKETKAAKDDFHPHMTIGNRDWSDGAFDDAWNEYRAKKFSASFTANRITLLRLDGAKWNVISEAPLTA
ncbi:MAG TPA: 2'-5' RNA ligase family protein [Bacteroidia bacterium]|nr:2'-5' RNA ligase family protein [Bacteroidia bacterium]